MQEPKILTAVNDELNEKLNKSFSITFFVGAGISVSSGIPSFRGAGTAKYFQGHYPVYLCSIKGFSEIPQIAWQYYYHLYELAKKAEPNLAHQALAAFQKEAIRRRVVKLNLLTTNFDGLINRADGQAQELHGNISTAICPACKTSYSMEEIEPNQLPPLCKCGNILFPNIVLLDDLIKKEHYDLCLTATRGCSVYIAIGTSGVNCHSYGFMKAVRMRPNTTLIEINPRPSHLTKDMDYVLRGTAEEILPQIHYKK
jgi:NAD-dependent deacetylase